MIRSTTRFVLSLILVWWQKAIQAEIIPMEVILDASSTEIHFVQGWLQAPAHIDISEMKFVTTEVPDFIRSDDDDQFDDDDEIGNEGTDVPNDNEDITTEEPVNNNQDTTTVPPATSAPTAAATTVVADDNTAATDDPNAATTTTVEPVPGDDNGEGTSEPTPGEEGAQTSEPTGSDGGDRLLMLRSLETPPRVQQLIDVVLFMIPENCEANEWGQCDWSTLGVGVKDYEVEGDVTFCCSEDGVTRGVCTSDYVGKLLIDHDLFVGEHRTAEVPTSPDQEFVLDDGFFDIADTGDYVMIISNCYDFGLDVMAFGPMEWKSVGGFLRGDMFGLMSFYIILSALFAVLVLWYWCGMKMYQDTSIPIQKYILTTMLLGLLEIVIKAADLGIWNNQGFRNIGIVYAGIGAGVLKRGISRCLGVMVAMGWGVVRDSLGASLAKIILLGLVYSGLTLARDYLVVFADTEVQSISTTAEEEVIDFALVLTPAIIAINLIFFFWILGSLNGTTEYLRNMNQTSKLRRHQRLKCLIMTYIFIATGWLVFSVVDALLGVLSPDQTWMLEGAMQANFLFVISGVGILWRPNSNAKDYALQMELPALGDEENELELSCVVPSAGDFDDGNDPDHPDGLAVDNAVVS